MSQLRRDPIINRWVIISTERARRPNDFRVEKQAIGKGGFCPFCEGNEAKTPAEIMAIRRPDSGPNQPGWSLRVVSNKFPAL
ncbi:MAG TPA: galactose-1-phosphate uridylyltransferase, partial [bacterium]|nr:galactose-1-phosphate uridylyltransferase [bacterium]